MPSIVQSAIAHVFTAGGHNTLSVTFGSAVTGGNLLMVFAISDNIGLGATAGPPTDSLSTPFSTTRGPDNDTNGNAGTQIWQGVAPSGGSDTITVSGFQESPFSNAIILIAVEISGSNGSGITSVFNSNDSGTFPLDSGSISANSGDLILGFGGTESFSVQVTQITYSPGSGFVVVQQLSSVSTDSLECTAALISQNAPSTGSFDTQMTPSKSFSWWLMNAVVIPGGVTPPSGVSHFGDMDVLGSPSIAHHGDIWVNALARQFVNLSMDLIFPIGANNFIKLAGTLLNVQRDFVLLAGTLIGKALSAVNLAGTLVASTRQYVKLAGTIQAPGVSHHGDCVVSITPPPSFVNLACSLIQPLPTSICGGFPDASYVKLEAWIIAPGGSTQMPGSPPFTADDDFLSSVIAGQAYRPISVFTLNGINLIITAFTAGVVSWQTRTRSWLTRQDEAPGGILQTTDTNVHTLPNGETVTTTTQTILDHDTTRVITTIVNSATPERVSTIITETTKSGQQTTQEQDSVNINGVIHTNTKKTVSSIPPVSDNIQPIQVRTLDGNIHYQFFGTNNPAWAGGDQEGVTNSDKQVSIQPGTLNGQTVDQFGNPILQRTTVENVQTPDGKVINTTTVETGIRDAGTTTTQTESSFNGITTTVIKKVTYPDGSQDVTTTVTNDVTGETTEHEVETVTDEYGQVTITTTDTDTKTFPDPVTGVLRTQVTKTVTVQKGGVTTVDTSSSTTNNFDDDIINDKIKVIGIQEFTLTCVIDEQSMFGLSEYNIAHQKLFALQDLFTQMLGNGNLSYALRQSLIEQFDAANCIKPLLFNANGKQYYVVFAPSASAFRAKYIVGTEPHVYELQLILQQRSDLINGTTGF